MTVWILQQELTPDEEAHIHERTHLTLPFGDLPDLSVVGSPIEARHLLKALHPQEPPEAITRRLDRFWGIYSTLQAEDVIAVPLKNRQEVALAEVTGRYLYRVGEYGSDIHMVPVQWYPKIVPMRAFRKHRAIFENSLPMVEVTDRDARVAIRDKLPHRYNRYAGIKWLLAIFIGMRIIRFVYGLLHGESAMP